MAAAGFKQVAPNFIHWLLRHGRVDKRLLALAREKLCTVSAAVDESLDGLGHVFPVIKSFCEQLCLYDSQMTDVQEFQNSADTAFWDDDSIAIEKD